MAIRIVFIVAGIFLLGSRSQAAPTCREYVAALRLLVDSKGNRLETLASDEGDELTFSVLVSELAENVGNPAAESTERRLFPWDPKNNWSSRTVLMGNLSAETSLLHHQSVLHQLANLGKMQETAASPATLPIWGELKVGLPWENKGLQDVRLAYTNTSQIEGFLLRLKGQHEKQQGRTRGGITAQAVVAVFVSPMAGWIAADWALKTWVQDHVEVDKWLREVNAAQHNPDAAADLNLDEGKGLSIVAQGDKSTSVILFGYREGDAERPVLLFLYKDAA